MGGGKKVGRKVETTASQNNWNPHSARNLAKKHLAGVIFGCTRYTYKECIFKQLFGLPGSHIQYVQNIRPGLPLFLFNYSDRTLHGIFEATTAGQMFIDRYAWTSDDQDYTYFPAQVRVQSRKQCLPLSEDQYKPILAKNYLEHEPNHLWFELDQVQTQGLISLFSTSRVSSSVSLPYTPATQGKHSEALVSPIKASSIATADTLNSASFVKGVEKSRVLSVEVMAEDKENATAYPEKKWTSLFNPQSNPPSSKESGDYTSEGHSTMSEDEPIFVGDAPLTGTTSDATRLAEKMSSKVNINLHAIVNKESGDCTSEEHSIMSEDEPISISDAPLTGTTSEATRLAEEMSSKVNMNLRAIVNKLMHEMAEIKELHSKQTQKIQTLEQELEEANVKLREFKSHRKEASHSGSSLSASHSEETQIETHDVFQSILLVGGFDGSSWLQNVDCYCPFEDVIRPLSHMKSVRSYGAAVKLDEKVYILGGGCNSNWYDTVESYDLKSHQWDICPALKRKKGSLASASLGGKIFAIGGGDATDCFSDIEVLDTCAGKWTVAKSMKQKRFSPAASTLNGMLYVAGGFDGHKYLSSVESFDPRSNLWTKLKDMNSRRGCHSLIVLNEKLYAIGGYDGTKMVPTVEMFEPRVGSWTMSEPMRNARGYLGSVNFGETIYAIGGMEENNDVLDTVECYSEAEGWRLAQLKSLGKRCFLSAVTV